MHQTKSAIVSGALDYYDNHTGQLIKTEPISAEALFNHLSSQAFGNIEALKPETKKQIGQAPLPFPPDGELILQAGDLLKDICKNIIYNNKELLLH
ncbi:MAG TPA: hypothetical protein PLO83_12095 [Gammaproteobacteria bacterium]|nr:hypothetical protein [Gammaproteobacteria bacterium]